MLTLEQHEAFAIILANAFEGTVVCNPHRGCHQTIREYLDSTSAHSDDTEEAIRVCEESGQLWQLHWYSNSVGQYTVVAPTFEALVREVLRDTPLEMLTTYEERSPSKESRAEGRERIAASIERVKQRR